MIMPFTKRIITFQPNFVYYNTTPVSNIEEMRGVAEDVSSQINRTTIGTAFSVPSVGIASVKLSRVTSSSIFTETISADKTSLESFWEDIRNWMLANNFEDIELIGNSYFIKNPKLEIYLYITTP